jgi:hypothetical protein
LAVVPRRKSPQQRAAFTAALMAFEFLLTHWAALYIVLFPPFVLLKAGQQPNRARQLPAWVSSTRQP